MRYLLEVIGGVIVVYVLIVYGPQCVTYVEQHGLQNGIERIWKGPE